MFLTRNSSILPGYFQHSKSDFESTEPTTLLLSSVPAWNVEKKRKVNSSGTFLQCIFKSLEESLANVKISRLSAFSSNYVIYSLCALPEGILIDRKKV